MAGFGEDTIFKMLASQFLPPGEAPEAPGLSRTAIPSFGQSDGESQFVDLGAGGPAPGSERENSLSSLGNFLEEAAPMIGGAMNQGPAILKKQGVNAGGFTPTQNPLDYLQIAPAKNPW
jgi:hypothetical protein